MHLTYIHGLTVASMVFILLVISGCDEEHPEPKEVLRPVRSIVVTDTKSGWVKEFPAVVHAVRQADLSFRVPGKLKKIFVNESQMVEQNQVIAQLDSVDFEIKLSDRQASYDAAKADFDRARKLTKSGAMAKAQLDTFNARVSTASAQLAAAQQELDYTILRAPFSGRVARRYIENFEEVSAKQVIISLQDTSALLVEMELSESTLVRAQKRKEDYNFQAHFSSFPKSYFPLTIKEMSTQADSNTQTYTMTFTMPAIDDHLVLPGMSVIVLVSENNPTTNLILIPAYAVMEDKNGRFTYVVTEVGNNIGIINRRSVHTGQLSNRGLAITSGLNVGERVVTAGMSQMREGMKVRLQEGNAR